MAETLKIVARTKSPPTPRGPMMNAAQIAEELYFGKVTAKWVLDCVPNKMKFGHRTVLWFRDDVVAHIESVRAA